MLGLQTFGENVKELSPAVQTTVDISDMYLIDRLEIPFISTAIPLVNGMNLGLNAQLTVPVGEVWRLWAASASVVSGAGGAATYSLAVRISGVDLNLSNPRTIGANVTDWNMAQFDKLWLPAGSQLGIFVVQVAGAASVGSGQALITRLKA